ncbi:MAG: B12-binding domain-containing protein, partial [Ignavibacteria bacterium]|nr:B12-binding domain-containing protein [Ignavibacteria bacterium]
ISSDSDYLSQIESLVVAMIELNEDGFEQILNHNIQKIGFEDTLYQVIYPFFEKIGVLWQTNTINPAQEHFISNLIRMKLIVAIDSLPRTTDENAKKIILFLPEWELHEIGLLAYFYIARKHGFKVIYLGQNVPLCDMVSVSEIVLPDILATYFVSAISLNEIKSYVNQLVKHFPNQELLFSGIQAANINFSLPSNAHLVASALEFKKNIMNFKAQNKKKLIEV